MSQASGTVTVFGETPQKFPMRWHDPSLVGEQILGRLGFTNSPGSAPQAGQGLCPRDFHWHGEKRGERIKCRSASLQLPTALMSPPAPGRCLMPGDAAQLTPLGCTGVAWLPTQPSASPAAEAPASSLLPPFIEQGCTKIQTYV